MVNPKFFPNPNPSEAEEKGRNLRQAEERDKKGAQRARQLKSEQGPSAAGEEAGGGENVNLVRPKT